MLLLLPEGYFLMILDPIPGRRYEYKSFFLIYFLQLAVCFFIICSYFFYLFYKF